LIDFLSKKGLDKLHLCTQNGRSPTAALAVTTAQCQPVTISQVFDLYRLCEAALFPGSLRKPLIYKASDRLEGNYQQSYPQKIWIGADVPRNQRLTRFFDS